MTLKWVATQIDLEPHSGSADVQCKWVLNVRVKSTTVYVCINQCHVIEFQMHKGTLRKNIGTVSLEISRN